MKKKLNNTTEVMNKKNKKSESCTNPRVNDYNPITIEGVSPEIDHGRFPAKAIVGEIVEIEVDIYKNGHDKLKANLKFRKKSESSWANIPMKACPNDRWQASFIPEENTTYFYTIEAWFDPLDTLLDGIEKKCLDSQSVKSEVLELLKLLNEVSGNALPKDKSILEGYAKRLELSEGVFDEVLRIIQEDGFRKTVSSYPIKRLATYYKELELTVDRKLAEFGTWYELFPRSCGTFKDCIQDLSRVQKMGFNVIYLPPIHPIGITNRKGKNNSLAYTKDDVGSPWAIGGKEGGHKSVHPALGTLDDFVEYIKAANDRGIEIALDYAIQCSPDHPYAKEHPEWFFLLPDGHIKYAENPPKKYQDIYPINFYPEKEEDKIALWEELKSILLFWINKGVKVFRVDNPHTKPYGFWEWVIKDIKEKFPDVIFLAEAFTRPKIMKYLAKSGFTQSYTYFTWRNSSHELREYLEELTKTDMKNYFKGNFFANTPDILHEYLQAGGRSAFKIRYALAATLSSSCGIYSGYELCENIPREKGSEEYLNSEKYEIKKRKWNQEGNIVEFITAINYIRNENPALHEYKNIEFYHSTNENILSYGKRTKDNKNIIVVAINLDPLNVQEGIITLPLQKFGIEGWETYQAKDLITSEKFYWKGESNFVRLDPNNQPAHILKIKK